MSYTPDLARHAACTERESAYPDLADGGQLTESVSIQILRKEASSLRFLFFFGLSTP